MFVHTARNFELGKPGKDGIVDYLKDDKLENLFLSILNTLRNCKKDDEKSKLLVSYINFFYLREYINYQFGIIFLKTFPDPEVDPEVNECVIKEISGKFGLYI